MRAPMTAPFADIVMKVAVMIMMHVVRAPCVVTAVSVVVAVSIRIGPCAATYPAEVMTVTVVAEPRVVTELCVRMMGGILVVGCSEISEFAKFKWMLCRLQGVDLGF